MALPASGQISLKDILDEKQGATTARTNVSLYGLSVDGQNDYTSVDIAGSPNQTAPYSVSEFYSYSQVIDFPASTYTYREYDGTFTDVASDATTYGQSSSANTAPNIGFSSYPTYVKLERTAGGYVAQVYQLTEQGPASNPRIVESSYYNTSGTKVSSITGSWQTAASGTTIPDSAAWSLGDTTGSPPTVTANNSAPSGDAATFAPAAGTFQALSSGQSIGLLAMQTASAGGTPPDLQVEAGGREIIFTLRKTGYNDTAVVKVMIYAQASAQTFVNPNPSPFPNPNPV